MLYRSLLLWLQLIVWITCGHKCVHDKVSKEEDLRQTHINYLNHPYSNAKDNLKPTDFKAQRKLLSEEYAAIRITPYYDYLDQTLSDDSVTLNYIKSLVSATIRFFEASISVYPIDGPLGLDRQCLWGYPTTSDTGTYYFNCIEYDTTDPTCGRVTIPDTHMGDSYLYTGSDTFDQVISGNGVVDSDLVLYVSADDYNCEGGTLAWATPCYIDDYGRTVAGGINFCPSSINPNNTNWKLQVDTTLHELTHVLIFSPYLWDYFRYADGSRIPASEVYDNTTNAPNTYIITDTVKQVAQDHFGCSTLIGAPIEDDGSAGSVGSHWEEHHLNSEFMGAVIYSALSYVSDFTWALMEDSGHYSVNYDYTEPFYWGKDEGCAFFTDDCVDTSTELSNYPQYFCESTSDNGCQHEHSAVAYCLMYTDGSIPAEFQWFTDSTIGGSHYSEYCPFRDPSGVYGAPSDFDDTCWDTRGNTYGYNYFGFPATYAKDSRCIDITNSGGTTTGDCFQMECVGYDSTSDSYASVNVMIGNETVSCLSSEQGTDKTLTGTYSAYTVTCPYFDTFCSTANPFGCFYGYWSDSLNACVCSPGYISDDCSITDTDILEDTLTIGSASPSTTSFNEYCIDGLDYSAVDLNDEFTYAGVSEVYSYYTNSDQSVYLWFDVWYHLWVLSVAKDNRNYYAVCDIGDSGDITECTNWLLGSSSVWVADVSVLPCLNATSASGDTPTPTDDGGDDSGVLQRVFYPFWIVLLMWCSTLVLH